MRTVIILAGLMLAACSTTSCKKDHSKNGSILVSVLYAGEEVSNPIIYLFTDTNQTPILVRQADAIGEAYFSDLAPGSYYLIANGKSYAPYTLLCGEKSVQITNKPKYNHYEIVIETLPCK